MIADTPLTSIDTLHDGVTVVVGSTRGKIFQYDLRMSSVPVRTLEAHKSSVQCLKFQHEIQVGEDWKIPEYLQIYQIPRIEEPWVIFQGYHNS